MVVGYGMDLRFCEYPSTFELFRVVRTDLGTLGVSTLSTLRVHGKYMGST